MVELKTLSKYKYLYRIYEANKNINMEKYPIIYSNKSYMYYKTGKGDALSYIKLDDVSSKYEDKSLKELNYYRRSIWVLNVSEFDMEDVRNKYFNKTKEDLVEKAKEKLDKAIQNYNDAKASYEGLLNYIKD